MLTLLNSNFEEWYMKNPDGALEDFKFSIGKMGKSGALFDLNKLSDISKNELAKLSAEEMFDFLQEWTNEFGTDAQKGYFADKEYLLKILTLCMGIGGKKRRKDFTTAKQAMEFISYFFDETFAPEYAYRFEAETVKTVLGGFVAAYDYADDCSAWFDKVKAVAAANGFATDMKAYKADPTAYPGNVSDVAEMLRIATTGLSNTPDLWTIMQILGKDRTVERLNKAIQAL
jgi:glutamyl-tRNA synthetase